MPESLATLYARRLPLLMSLAACLEQEIGALLQGAPYIDRISFRAKSPDSFHTKATDLTREKPYRCPLVEIEDQVAGRVLVLFRKSVRDVVDRLSARLNRVEVVDRKPERDDRFGYESYHMICTIPIHAVPRDWDRDPDMPKTFELQVRTLFMHAWAEPQHELEYKSVDDLSADDRRTLAWVAASSWGADQALQQLLEKRAHGRHGTSGPA